jgi:hypothetical protein
MNLIISTTLKALSATLTINSGIIITLLIFEIKVNQNEYLNPADIFTVISAFNFMGIYVLSFF